MFLFKTPASIGGRFSCWLELKGKHNYFAFIKMTINTNIK